LHDLPSKSHASAGVETTTKDAEGANLEQANPDESLRQKDPASELTLENPARDTDGVKF